MKKDKIKILFVLPSLRPGGAERVVSFIASKINRNNFLPTLVILGFKKDAAYEIPNTNLVFLNQNRTLTAIPALFSLIKKESPDIVFSSIGQLNALLGCFSLFFKKTKFVGRAASIFSSFDSHNKNVKKINLNSFYRFAYQRLHAVICQSEDMYNEVQKKMGTKETKMFKIPNPAREDIRFTKNREGSDKLRCVTVGRLSPEKGHLRVLEALNSLGIAFQYTIIGSGVEETKIKDLVKHLKLDKHVTYIPFTKEVDKYLGENDVFLQGSFSEGFPNALMESCLAGTPVLAFDCPGGTKEIVQHGINGYLAKDSHDFTKRLHQIASKEWHPNEIRQSVLDKFSADIILNKYEELFRKLL
ncbi:glycosyltransferase [uncultured Croceitalea sp.]|uniref:glycosyltransferase n=1 Tax=uncultured Croceitalea sp. TaxID=1798908 RepID=UPI003306331E